MCEREFVSVNANGFGEKKGLAAGVFKMQEMDGGGRIAGMHP
jgi:hypothetical protein